MKEKEDKSEVIFTIMIVFIIMGVIAYLVFILSIIGGPSDEKRAEWAAEKKIKEDSRKLILLDLFNNDENIYCKNENKYKNKRDVVNNENWISEGNKFINKKDGYYYFVLECSIK